LREIPFNITLHMNPDKLILGGIALISVVPFVEKAGVAKKGKLPNIIYIYADDLGVGDIGCYGQEYIKTPNIDRLASEGIRFTQHYSGAPVSAPARCCLMTGKNLGHSYIRNNFELKAEDEADKGQMPIPDEARTLPEMLKEAGYKTALIGKWGLGPISSEGAPNRQGFDLFYGYCDQVHAHNHYPYFLWRNDKMEILRNEKFSPQQKFDGKDLNDLTEYQKYKGPDYSLDLMADEAVKFIRGNREGHFFIDLSFIVPHKALQVPDESLEMYEGVFNEKPYPGGQGYLPHPRPLSAYAAMISRMDQKIGMIMEELKELGLDRNTIVMFSSDNGPASGGGLDASFFRSSGGLRGSKSQVYEGGIRVPFIVRWPAKIRTGSETDHISAQYDLMATLAELTGRDPGNTDGISFLPVLEGKMNKQKQHEYLYWEFSSGDGQIAVRIGDLKGVRRNIARDPESKWEIYDLKNDPLESVNISDKYPELPAKLNSIVSQRTSSNVEEWNFMERSAPGR
jgi:arylsulfatase A-like enzyme